MEERHSLCQSGIQSIKAGIKGSYVTFSGASIYWCYNENDYYVMGQGSIKYSRNPLIEVLVFKDGTQKQRSIEYFPDMQIGDIWLGHWNGKELNG